MYVTGFVVMPGGEIVLCDYANYKLKMLDNSDVLINSVKVSAKPWDISIVDSKTAIITLPRAKQLRYIEVFPRLTEGRPMQLDKECWDVLVTGDKILISCHNDPGEAEIKILDLDGHLLQQLGINQDGSRLFSYPFHITACQSEEKVFVSDRGKGTVTCMTMNNQVIYEYTDKEMKCPRGLYCDGGDNILVCDRDSDTIQVITAEGEKRCDLVSSIDGIKKPISISYRQSDDTLIVGCDGSSDIFLFKLGT